MNDSMNPSSIRLEHGSGISLRMLILFLTGAMTMIHLVTLFSYVLYGVVIVGLVGLWIVLLFRRHSAPVKKGLLRYLLWYGLFAFLIVASMVYTVNTVNPDYVLKRVLVIFALGLIVSDMVQTKRDFGMLANGLIAGGLMVALISVTHEGLRVGIGRIGKATVGSAVALSGIMIVSFVCAVWQATSAQKKKWIYGALAVFFFAVIVLTGSRRALLISAMFVIAQVFVDNGIQKSRKMMLVLALALAGCIFGYMLFANEQLYNLIGWRLESMIQTALGTASSEDASMRERSVMKAYAYELFAQRPWLGYGAHGFAYMFDQYYGKLLYSHCGYTEILSCYGIVGFVIFYWVFLVFLKQGRNVLAKGDSCQKALLIYAALTLACEVITIAFITPQVVVMLTAGLNMVSRASNRSGIEHEK